MNVLMKQVRPFFTGLMQKRPSYLPPHTKLIIGVSGGVDSIALLHILKTIYQPNQLIVAHLDHQLRSSSAKDAQFVQEIAASWHIPCDVKKIDVAQLAGEQSLSLEEAGRLARYEYFGQLALREGARAVLVAHHADDQAETVLMHLLRGTGLSGLRGMLSVAPLLGADDCLLIRPFLHTTRAEIETYCQEHDLQHIQDASNNDTRFLRNRVRHELLPILADYSPQIFTRLQQLATTVAADYELLEMVTEESWTAVLHSHTPETIQLKLADWLTLPLALRRRTLRKAVQILNSSVGDIGLQTIEQAREVIEKKHTGAQAFLPGGLLLIMGYHLVTITANPHFVLTDLPQLLDEQPATLPVPGIVPLANGWQMTASFEENINWQQIQINQDAWTAYIDVGETSELIVRGRLAGDRFQPLGMKGQTVKLKELMINRKIPAQFRKRWPLIVHQDQIVWVTGHHLAETVQVKPETSRVVKLQCQIT